MTILGKVELLLVLERHRNRGTTSVEVKQALWQAEQAVKAVSVLADFIENDPNDSEKFFAVREAWRKVYSGVE